MGLRGSLNVLLIVKCTRINTPEGVLKQFQRNEFIEMLIKGRVIHLRHI